MRDLEAYKTLSKGDYQEFAGPDWPTYEQFVEHKDIPDLVYNEIDNFLKSYTKFVNPAFCVLPFYGFEYPQNTPCCLMKPHNITQVRQRMLDGIRPVACDTCWKLEDIGIPSDRQLKNNMLDYYTDRDISKLYQQAKDGKNSIVSYKIDTSAICNATCVTCGPSLSSAWQQLKRKNKKAVFNIKQSMDESTVAKLINYNTAVSINFRGGEPLLSKTNFVVLEQLIKHNNTDCFVSFTTNGSIRPDDYQLSLLKQFKNLDFNFSIDGVGKVFEYMRYPLTWHKLLENIDFCKQYHIPISVSYTISNLNILYHRETTQWFKDHNINYINNIVVTPRHFRPGALPQQIKLKIIELTQSQEIGNFLKNHASTDIQDYNRLLAAIREQDSWKGISITDYLPDFVAISNYT